MRTPTVTKDEFVATVSHELRTPLNAILGWVQMLQTGTIAQERQQRALAIVERNARSQSKLIEDLLDVSRMMSGSLQLSVEPVHVSAIVEQTVESIRLASEAKQIRLQTVLDTTASVIGDPQRLQQVLANLLSNAIKFTPKGGRVQVTVERLASSVEVRVADTGQGIDAAFLPHVFERFQQADRGNPSQLRSRPRPRHRPPHHRVARRTCRSVQRRQRSRVDVHRSIATVDRRAAERDIDIGSLGRVGVSAGTGRGPRADRRR